MIIHLTSIDLQGKSREFFLQPSKIEVGFDVVSYIASKDPTLIKIGLLDQGHYIPLPIEAFDGAPLADPIQKLEKEWTYLLEQPLQTTKQPTDEEILTWARRQVYRHEKNIIAIEEMIDAFHKWIQDSEDFFPLRKQPSRRTAYFRFMLEQCELKLSRATAAHELAVKRLGELVSR